MKEANDHERAYNAFDLSRHRKMTVIQSAFEIINNLATAAWLSCKGML